MIPHFGSGFYLGILNVDGRKLVVPIMVLIETHWGMEFPSIVD